jgi:hypothetical protein
MPFCRKIILQNGIFGEIFLCGCTNFLEEYSIVQQSLATNNGF